MGSIRLLGIPLFAAFVLAGSLGVLPAAAQTKTAQGTVTAVSDASLTVKVGNTDMTFDVDSKTVVQAPGAGRQTRTARAAGAPGIKLTDVVKSGGAVLVTYRAANGRNLATNVRSVSSAGAGGGSVSEPAKTATGTVKSVTADSLVVTGGGKDSTFAVDRDTRVLGRGAGTATRGAGGRIAITNLVSAGDTVSVSYREAGGAMTATVVRVTTKKP